MRMVGVVVTVAGLLGCSGEIFSGGPHGDSGTGGGSGTTGGSTTGGGTGNAGTGGGVSSGGGGGATTGGGGGAAGTWSYSCDPATVGSATLDTVKADFANQIYPLLVRSSGGCVSCHTGVTRFQVSTTAGATFDLLRANGMLAEGPGTMIARLSQGDALSRMPRGGPLWTNAELDLAARVVCTLNHLGADPCQGAPVDPGPSPIRRLTPAEYDNTVHDLLGDTTAPGAHTFPPENEALGFDNNADVQGVDVLRADKLIDAAAALAAAAPLATFAPCATQATVPANCGTTFIATFGKKAFRSPVTAEETTRLTALYDDAKTKYGAPTAIRMVLQAMLLAPRFLYRVELGGGTSGQVVHVTSAEMASRLSYLFWKTMPDTALTAAADADQLKTPAQVEAQARRLLADPRAHAVTADFHAQWLQLDTLELASKDTAVLANFETLKPLMRTEAEKTTEDIFWNGTANAYFLGTTTFLNKPLATFYGVTGPTGAAFEKVNTDASKRMGVLTQAGFLAGHAHADQSDPVNRGKFVREQVLCQTLPPPPATVELQPPVPTAGTTTRERFAAHRQAGSSCMSCHQLMDPIGVGFENYDAAGAYRTLDNGKPVDASGEIVQSRDADGAFSGAIALTQRLGASADAKNCLATQWFRYASGRGEAPADLCSLKKAQATFASKGFDSKELWIALTQTDAFLYRRAP